MIIKYPIQISPYEKRNFMMVEIKGYEYLEELLNELDKIGAVNHLKDIPQLGNIPVAKVLQRTRYDYVMLQLYLHQFVKEKISDKLEYSYNNSVSIDDLGLEINTLKCKPTIADCMQILTVASNIGHFYNTFSASLAAVSAMSQKEDLRSSLFNLLEEEDTFLLEDIEQDFNYQHFHLINGLILLEKLDRNKFSVSLAKNLLRLYLQPDRCSEKILFLFDTFKKIRSFAYFIYDLPVSKMPLLFDVQDSGGLERFLLELLGRYNNKILINSLWKSVNKLLDDIVYNEKTQSIITYQIATDIEKRIIQIEWNADFYLNSIMDHESVFNCKYTQNKQFDHENILKITLYPDDNVDSMKLVKRLSVMEFVKVGFNNRFDSGGMTILVALKNNCEKHSQKVQVSWRILKEVLSAMHNSKHIEPSDDRYIAVMKFFLYYLFGESPIKIEPTVDERKCIVVERGKTARILELTKILDKGKGNDDSRYEIEVLKMLLQKEDKNDVSVIIAGSIVVYPKILNGEKSHEYDGLILFPNRDTEQIIFVESKNRKQSGKAKRCLQAKLDDAKINYPKNGFGTLANNSYIKVSIAEQ